MDFGIKILNKQFETFNKISSDIIIKDRKD